MILLDSAPQSGRGDRHRQRGPADQGAGDHRWVPRKAGCGDSETCPACCLSDDRSPAGTFQSLAAAPQHTHRSACTCLCAMCTIAEPLRRQECSRGAGCGGMEGGLVAGHRTSRRTQVGAQEPPLLSRRRGGGGSAGLRRRRVHRGDGFGAAAGRNAGVLRLPFRRTCKASGELWPRLQSWLWLVARCRRVPACTSLEEARSTGFRAAF